jgi:hypothetical protein
MPPKDVVTDLLDRLSDCRARVVMDGGRTAIQKPKGGFAPDEAERFADLLPLMRLHRDAILARLAPTAPGVADANPPRPPETPEETEPWTCRTCRRAFFVSRETPREYMTSPLWCGQPRCPVR